MLRCFVATVLVHMLLAFGCTSTEGPGERRPLTALEGVYAQTDGLRVTLLRAPPSVATSADLGWAEYALLLENRGSLPLTVSAVKLATSGGRYLSAAVSEAETQAPPDPVSEVAGGVATSAAGIAAGQVIPFGGQVVGMIARVADASSAESRARAARRFRLRQLVGVELAPGGRMEGSAFFPRMTDATALVLDFTRNAGMQRVELPLLAAKVDHEGPDAGRGEVGPRGPLESAPESGRR